MNKNSRHPFNTMLLLCGASLLIIGVTISCGDKDTAPIENSDSTSAGSKLGGVSETEVLYSAGLVGSRHDFTQQGDRSLDLCTPCHTPHLPLPRGAGVGEEDRGRLVSYQADGVELDGASLLCLSCHDGVIASDVYTASHATTFAAQFGTSRLGTALLAGHPIGVKYPATESTYRAPAAVTADGRIKLPDGRVQCISCHDPHNTGRHEGMLVKSNSGSRLCLACHRL
ncbi:MAG: cytochrome c3 family protein [Phycisphaerae bacterium]|nr:cytochrome c3 family protein [Phycisphaerae bacterium]